MVSSGIGSRSHLDPLKVLPLEKRYGRRSELEEQILLNEMVLCFMMLHSTGNNGSRHYFDKLDLKCNDTEWDLCPLSCDLIDMPSEDSYIFRLPIESIIRLKSVCKKWNRMTQDPVFINSQLSWSKVHPPKLLLTTNAEPTSIFLTETSEFKAKKLIDVNDVEKPIVMCSFNGLICIGSRTHLDPLKICNPTTMELLELPHSNFTDSVRHHRAALGYDNITKRYKVVLSYESGVGLSFLQIIECVMATRSMQSTLPDDLVFDILCRLPIESIIRFKSVCKSWNCMTQDPVFINSQLSWSKVHPPKLLLTTEAAPSSFFLTETSEFKAKKLMDINNVEDPIVMCSFRGLICIGSRTHLDPLNICNPITREFLELPHSNSTDRVRCHRVALGYDDITKKYIVVRSYENDCGRPCIQSIDVLSFGETVWKKIRTRETDFEEWYGPVFHDGRFYWLFENQLLQLDLSTGEFLYSPDPFLTPLPIFWPTPSLLNLDGRLVLTIDDENDLKIFYIFIVNGPRICINRMDLKLNGTEENYSVVDLMRMPTMMDLVSMPSRNNCLLGVTMIHNHRRLTRSLVTCNLLNNTVTRFCSEDFIAMSFEPSLVSPNMAMPSGNSDRSKIFRL
ncbi:hypothetical protein L6164_013516 [Bauhinia variegata]|uniref:Uncharacterized protein n=1 Tax=Bauhinia variegata TaxID=167791 RepID=A0ACB9NEK2_BAUVA|nr:hypothetical protein L6164_013516 [Bauhinia variegata]